MKKTQLKSFKNNKTHQQELKGITQKNIFFVAKTQDPHWKSKEKTQEEANIQKINTNPFEIIKKTIKPLSSEPKLTNIKKIDILNKNQNIRKWKSEISKHTSSEQPMVVTTAAVT